MKIKEFYSLMRIFKNRTCKRIKDSVSVELLNEKIILVQNVIRYFVFHNNIRRNGHIFLRLWWKIHVRILVMRYKRKLIAIQSILRRYRVKKILSRIIKDTASRIIQLWWIRVEVKYKILNQVQLNHLIALQSRFKMMIEKRKYLQMKNCAIILKYIRKNCKKSLLLQYKNKKAAVIKLQKLIKLFLLNRKYNKNWPVLISFQAAIRGRIVRSKIILFTYELMQHSAVITQSWWRMVIQRKIYQKLYFLVQRLQSLSRGYLIRSDQVNLKAIIIFMNSTANKLQRWFRRICRDGTGSLQRKVAIDCQRKIKSNSYEELKKKTEAKIRASWKKMYMQLPAFQMKKKRYRLLYSFQILSKGYIARRKFEKKRNQWINTATAIQKWWKEHNGKNLNSKKRKNLRSHPNIFTWSSTLLNRSNNFDKSRKCDRFNIAGDNLNTIKNHKFLNTSYINSRKSSEEIDFNLMFIHFQACLRGFLIRKEIEISSYENVLSELYRKKQSESRRINHIYSAIRIRTEKRKRSSLTYKAVSERPNRWVIYLKHNMGLRKLARSRTILNWSKLRKTMKRVKIRLTFKFAKIKLIYESHIYEREKLEQLRNIQTLASVKIQSWWRMNCERLFYTHCLNAFNIVQCVFRSYLLRKKYKIFKQNVELYEWIFIRAMFYYRMLQKRDRDVLLLNKLRLIQSAIKKFLQFQ
ncbi:abnormal spindle-like microcephaly-associated protein homolog isoform X3 [Centruroides vittatus]|uniref:abnormal spindle-like microcephaly-associated protein homolog isoform X3 n=1 Tax=Centruroides vittatus TaxID=120091 RepID=UPI00350FC0A0